MKWEANYRRFQKSWVHIIGRALQSFLFAIFFIFFLFNEKIFRKKWCRITQKQHVNKRKSLLLLRWKKNGEFFFCCFVQKNWEIFWGRPTKKEIKVSKKVSGKLVLAELDQKSQFWYYTLRYSKILENSLTFQKIIRWYLTAFSNNSIWVHVKWLKL